jgi:hypothetical protein
LIKGKILRNSMPLRGIIAWQRISEAKVNTIVRFDYMGHEQTGGKGLIYLIDGIWRGESW